MGSRNFRSSSPALRGGVADCIRRTGRPQQDHAESGCAGHCGCGRMCCGQDYFAARLHRPPAHGNSQFGRSMTFRRAAGATRTGKSVDGILRQSKKPRHKASLFVQGFHINCGLIDVDTEKTVTVAPAEHESRHVNAPPRPGSLAPRRLHRTALPGKGARSRRASAGFGGQHPGLDNQCVRAEPEHAIEATGARQERGNRREQAAAAIPITERARSRCRRNGTTTGTRRPLRTSPETDAWRGSDHKVSETSSSAAPEPRETRSARSRRRADRPHGNRERVPLLLTCPRRLRDGSQSTRPRFVCPMAAAHEGRLSPNRAPSRRQPSSFR